MALNIFFLMLLMKSMVNTQQEMKLTLFPKDTSGGQCLDGSPAGYYYSAPPSGSSDLWIIYLEGGGACNSEESCTQRSKGKLGSSKNWPTTYNSNTNPVMSDNAIKNPDFYSGHHVYAPYCSGDVWSGQRLKPSTDPINTWGFYFSGHLIFEQIIQHLSENMNMLNAKYILLTGQSAGGIATFGNIDWLTNEFKQKGGNTTIKAAPVAGWFCPGNTTDQPLNPMMPPNDYPHWINHENGGAGHNDSQIILYDSYLEPKCVTALGANLSWHCGSIHNLYKYISTPIFVIENKFDKNQIESGFLMPTNTTNANTTGFVEYYGIDSYRSIITQLIDEKNNQNGLFYPSCFDHVGGLQIAQGNTTINGYNSTQLVGDWFWERNKVPHFVYDTCNNDTNKLPCNPTCHSYPPP